MNKMSKIQDLHDVEERRCNLLIIESLKYSPKIYTEKELTRILNPYGQEKLTKLKDLADKNKHVSITEIAETLWQWGFIYIFNNVCYSCKPYTYNYIIPILKNGRLLSFDEEIVLTKKVEDKLQQWCDKKLSFKQGQGI